jgi:hypothetical protein
MREQDLAAYQAVRRPALKTVFADFNILVPDVPSGGPALLATLKLLPDINSSAGEQGTSLPHLVSLANASENVYRKAFLGIWGNSSEKILLFCVGFQAFAVIVIQVMVLTWVSKCCNTGLFGHLRGTYCIHLQDDRISTLRKNVGINLYYYVLC